MTPNQGKGHPAFISACDDLKEMHLLKSGGYGTGADPFANFTAVAAGSDRQRWEYACDRMVEKVTRIRSLTSQGRFSELREEFRDVMGLAGCCDAMLEDDYYDQLPAPVSLHGMASVPAPDDCKAETPAARASRKLAADMRLVPQPPPPTFIA